MILFGRPCSFSEVDSSRNRRMVTGNLVAFSIDPVRGPPRHAGSLRCFQASLSHTIPLSAFHIVS